jgi:hypothetical protein
MYVTFLLFCLVLQADVKFDTKRKLKEVEG